jgi:nicotinate phosphoribosyltransferase
MLDLVGALKAARAFYIAGVRATSNVAAGLVYGIPIAGTMGHSYIQAHDDELEAFRSFAKQYPDTVLLVDTYDTLAGVQKVIDLAHALGSDFQIRAVRLDSGDLLDLSVRARRLLDEAGLQSVEIVASSSLDEDEIARLISAGAPITGFGVGTEMGVSSDAPSLDMAYKLVEYAGRSRIKLSSEKWHWPGQKQVFRVEHAGVAEYDVLSRHDELAAEGRPLLWQVMSHGIRLPAGRVTLDEARSQRVVESERLPPRLRAISPADPPYEVRISNGLTQEADHARKRYASVAMPDSR